MTPVAEPPSSAAGSGNVTPVQSDDSYWQRPSDPAGPGPEVPTSPAVGPIGIEPADPLAFAGPPADIRYAGPPAMAPPATGWRPERIVEPAPPRRLPAQDHSAIDADEARARAMTYGIGVLAGVALVILLCAVCGRALF